MATDGNQGRTGADEVLAASLASGKTVKESAAAAGVSERTAFRRLEDSAFISRVTHLRSAMVSAAVGRLADGMSAAADVLRKLLANRDPNVCRLAAGKLLDLGIKATELVELENRVKDLEQRLSDTPHGDDKR